MVERYKIKPCWEIIKTGKTSVALNLITGSLIKFRNLKKEEANLFKKLYKRKQILGKTLIKSSLKKLAKENIIEKEQLKINYPEGLDRQIDYLSAFETNKISRKDLYERIVSKRIAILGVGSMGQWILPALVSSGFEKITIADFDIVEERNIINQPLFSRADIGKFKVDVVKIKLKEMNPNIKITSINQKLLSIEEISKICRRNDLIVHACDFPRFEIHNLITKACFINNTPNLMVWPGKIGPLNIPNKTPCYGCVEEIAKKEFPLWSELKEKLKDTENRKFPALRVTTAISGTIAAGEIITWALEIIPPRSTSEMLYWDPKLWTYKSKKIGRISTCKICGKDER